MSVVSCVNSWNPSAPAGEGLGRGRAASGHGPRCQTHSPLSPTLSREGRGRKT